MIAKILHETILRALGQMGLDMHECVVAGCVASDVRQGACVIGGGVLHHVALVYADVAFELWLRLQAQVFESGRRLGDALARGGGAKLAASPPCCQ